ncbi:MAG: hypothetical protein M1816_005620 [Peltula sp. TS41687]|nr:MAG: hypothetical protein M1816_005620 [Peltula sp. TS41687]
MARTLPWLKNKLRDSEDVRTRERPRKRRKVVGLESDDEPAAPKPKARPGGHAARVRQARTPSTSPPPQPPQEEFMIEGLDNDDIYIMVEDELLSVAQSFTQHLHHAEYVRMKNQAKSQNASAIQSISRPTDSRVKMTEELKRKKAAQRQKTKQNAVLDSLGATRGKVKLDDLDSELDEDTDNDPWTGTSLQGLMTGSRRSKQSLSTITGVKSGSRAAAGFSRARTKTSPERTSLATIQIQTLNNRGRLPNLAEESLTETGDEDDDDLDAPISRAVPKRAPNRLNSMSESNAVSRVKVEPSSSYCVQPHEESTKVKVKSEINPLRPKVENRLFSSTPARSDLPRSTESQYSSIKYEDDSLFDHIPKPTVLSGNVARRIQQRLADMKAKEEQQEGNKLKLSSLNEIPTFLNG